MSVTQKIILNSAFQVLGSANVSTSSSSFVSTGLGITVSPLITGRFYVSVVGFYIIGGAATFNISVYTITGTSIPTNGSAVTGSQIVGFEAAPSGGSSLTSFVLTTQVTVGTVTSFYLAFKTSASSLTIYRDSGINGSQGTSIFAEEV